MEWNEALVPIPLLCRKAEEEGRISVMGNIVTSFYISPFELQYFFFLNTLVSVFTTAQESRRTNLYAEIVIREF